MTDLQKIVADLSALTVLDTDEAQNWVLAELIARRGEAVRLADSLDTTFAYVAAQCEKVRAVH